MFKKLFFAVAAVIPMLAIVSCQEKGDELISPARISVDPTTLTFAYDASATTAESQTVSLTATRDWEATVSGAGITVTPSSGAASDAPQTITITSEPNTGGNATAIVTFTAATANCTLTITREGALGDISTIEEVIAAADNASVETQGLVVATCSMGIIISDETGNIFVYRGTSAVGDFVSVEGTRATYNNAPQISDATVTKITTADVPAIEPVVLTGTTADALVGTSACVYIQYEGTLTVSGNYYNVNIDGASTATGSVYGATDALNLPALAGRKVVVTGYYLNTVGSSFLNTVVTKIEESTAPYITVDEEYQSVTAAAGTVSFAVVSNVDWTVTKTSGDWATLNTTSGSDDGTIQIAYEANTDSNSRSAEFTLSASGRDPISLTVSQMGAGVKSYVKVTTAPADWSGTYLIVAETTSAAYAFTGAISDTSTPYGLYAAVTVTDSAIEYNSTTSAYEVVIAKDGNYYTMSCAAGYLGWTSGNSLTAASSVSSDNYRWTISVDCITNAADSKRNLRYNSSSPRFACYTSVQTLVYLYKLSE